MHLKLGNRKEFFPAENRFDSLFISEIFWEGKQRNQLLLLYFSRFSTINGSVCGGNGVERRLGTTL
jgi:hypothetical protein